MAELPSVADELRPPVPFTAEFLDRSGTEQLRELWSLTSGQAESTLGVVGGLSLLGPVESKGARDAWRSLMTSGEGLEAVAHPNWDSSRSLDPDAVTSRLFRRRVDPHSSRTAGGQLPRGRSRPVAARTTRADSALRPGRRRQMRGNAGTGDAARSIGRGVPHRCMAAAGEPITKGRLVQVRQTSWRPAPNGVQGAPVSSRQAVIGPRTNRALRRLVDLHDRAGNLVHADRGRVDRRPVIAVFAVIGR